MHNFWFFLERIINLGYSQNRNWDEREQNSIYTINSLFNSHKKRRLTEIKKLYKLKGNKNSKNKYKKCGITR